MPASEPAALPLKADNSHGSLTLPVGLWRRGLGLVHGIFQSRIMVKMLHGFATVAALTLLSKAVSFFKDATVAHRFGTADELDAYVLAFTFWSFLASVLGCGMPEAFVPAFAEVRHRRSFRRAQRLGVQAGFNHAVVLLMVGLLVYALAPHIISITGGGFSPAKKASAIWNLQHLMPFFWFYGMALYFAIWLRAEKFFAMAASAPMLPPLVIIASLLLGGSHATIHTLLYGTLAGTALHMVVLGAVVWRKLPDGWQWLKRCAQLWEPQNWNVMRNAFAYLLGGVVFGVSTVVDQTMASWLQPGSVVVLNYSDKVCSIVLALTATAASEALFPYFADSVARREWALLKKHLLHLTGLILLVAIPMTLVLIFFAPLVVHLLFQRGSFGPEDTARVASVLRCLALQIPFYIAGTIASTLAVSLQATRFLLISCFGAMAVNIGLNWLLMGPLGVSGIALSTACVHLLSAAALYLFLFHRIARLMHEANAAAARETASAS
jgi:putative peptidoglycan lipid II flippase